MHLYVCVESKKSNKIQYQIVSDKAVRHPHPFLSLVGVVAKSDIILRFHIPSKFLRVDSYNSG